MPARSLNDRSDTRDRTNRIRTTLPLSHRSLSQGVQIREVEADDLVCELLLLGARKDASHVETFDFPRCHRQQPYDIQVSWGHEAYGATDWNPWSNYEL